MAEANQYKIQVDVRAEFLPDQSDPSSDHYVFAYHITITNRGNVGAQLISRHWVITDAEQQVQEVRGLGVIGEQPLLQPGQSFQYTSGCSINTPVGTMRGAYQMTAADGVQFDAPVDEFLLSMPRILH